MVKCCVMTDVADPIHDEGEAVSAVANQLAVWVPWYFTRGLLSVVTAPLFCFLLFSVAISAIGAVIQGLALIRAAYAILGILGAFLALTFGLWFVIIPPALYYSLLKNLPGLWLRPDAARRTKLLWSLALVILLPATAYVMFHAIAFGIGWLADRDPCAAFAVGVTGSEPPVDCP